MLLNFIFSIISESISCDRCQSKWASTLALQKHIAEIHKTVVFPCELCGRTFRCRYTKTAHVREVHQKTDEYPCDKCPKVFTRRYQLHTHRDELTLRRNMQPHWPHFYDLIMKFHIFCNFL